MQTYLVELYVPRPPRGDAAASGARARAAAVELAGEGVRIDYLRTTFLPDDETCFHVVAAGACEDVRRLCRRAGFEQARIAQAEETS